MKRKRQTALMPALDLIEASVHLLRAAPPQALLAYYAGSAPFLLALLFYWSDMSRSPFAERHLVGGALGLAILFVWMKCWQSVFAETLRRHLSGERATAWTFSRLSRLVARQVALQPMGLFLLPIALVVAVPFGWLWAFHNNVVALGARGDDSLRPFARRAWKQALFDGTGNHVLIFALVLLAMFVWLNLVITAFAVPFVLRSLTGIETPFTLSIEAMFNTTFWAVVTGLAYLCVDPLVKTAYVLRCFHGESRQSGEDLRVELRRYAASVLVVILLCATPCICAAKEDHYSQLVHPNGMEISKAKGCEERATLDSCVNWPATLKMLPICMVFFDCVTDHQTKAEREGTFTRFSRNHARFPQGSSFLATLGFREEIPAGFFNLPFVGNDKQRGEGSGMRGGYDEGLRNNASLAVAAATPSAPAPSAKASDGAINPSELDRSIDEVLRKPEYTWRTPRQKLQIDTETKGFKLWERFSEWLKDGFKRFGEWLEKILKPSSGTAPKSFSFFSGRGLAYMLIVLVTIIIGLLLYFIWRIRFKGRGGVETAAAAAMPPDLADENVTAEQLPEDGWLRLALEMVERGDLRLALRAFYLASLAHLAERNFVTLAKFKSNRDYERELHRRQHAIPEIAGLFSENVNDFDRVWYGLHEVSSELLERFRLNVERMKTC